jgi:hypothetical protein
MPDTRFIVISPTANEQVCEYLGILVFDSVNDLSSVVMKKIAAGTRADKNATILKELRMMPPRDECIFIADDSLGNETQILVEFLLAAGEKLRVLCSKRPQVRYGVRLTGDLIPHCLMSNSLDTLNIGEVSALRYLHHRDEFDLVDK